MTSGSDKITHNIVLDQPEEGELGTMKHLGGLLRLPGLEFVLPLLLLALLGVLLLLALPLVFPVPLPFPPVPI